MLVLEQVRKIYRGARAGQREVCALRDVSAAIPRGSFTVVTGPSGSGKSTLLLTAGGLIRPTHGRVLFEGADLYALSPGRLAGHRNREIGFVLQSFHLIPYLTAVENVMVPMIFGAVPPHRRQRTAARLLARLELGDRLQHLPRELSAGQQQRVAIARALAVDPGLILADEPTGNLDPELAAEILAILRRLHEEDGRTILMVTHSPLAAAAGHRRLHLRDGALVDGGNGTSPAPGG